MSGKATAPKELFSKLQFLEVEWVRTAGRDCYLALFGPDLGSSIIVSFKKQK